MRRLLQMVLGGVGCSGGRVRSACCVGFAYRDKDCERGVKGDSEFFS